VSFVKNSRRRFEPGRAQFALPPLVASPMMRLFAFALVAFVAAVYGVLRHYTMRPPPTPAPAVAPPAPTYDADAGEYPVPEMYWQGEGGP
jgi:hypothetical protein